MNDKDFKEAILKEISEENLPVHLGGTFSLFNEPYEFDQSVFNDTPVLSFEQVMTDQLRDTSLGRVSHEEHQAEEEDDPDDTWQESHVEDESVIKEVEDSEGQQKESPPGDGEPLVSDNSEIRQDGGNTC